MTTPATATEWMRSSLRPCAKDPEQWFTRSAKAKELAIEGCAVCPLLTPCRDYALTQQPSHGVWGGLTETERRKYRDGTPACQTLSGFMRHRAKGEQCTPCESWRTGQVEADRRSRLADEHLKGGTRTGARIHLRLGEKACRACSAASYRERQAELADRPPRRRRAAA